MGNPADTQTICVLGIRYVEDNFYFFNLIITFNDTSIFLVFQIVIWFNPLLTHQPFRLIVMIIWVLNYQGPLMGETSWKAELIQKKQKCLLWALVNPFEDRKSYFFGTKLSWNSPALTSLLLSILFIFLIFLKLHLPFSVST